MLNYYNGVIEITPTKRLGERKIIQPPLKEDNWIIRDNMMNKPFIITYDLCGKGKDYSGLTDSIKKYDDNFKITESCWIIFCDESSSITIRDHLKQFLDSDDRIFVGLLEGNDAWTNVLCNSQELADRLNKYIKEK